MRLTIIEIIFPSKAILPQQLKISSRIILPDYSNLWKMPGLLCPSAGVRCRTFSNLVRDQSADMQLVKGFARCKHKFHLEFAFLSQPIPCKFSTAPLRCQHHTQNTQTSGQLSGYL